ncbi:MAG TPA: signal peptidase I [Defluviitaleaceae bacterium]|nr:signal peptidase I [Defluviitaleaceae bacterium]HPT76231.1 signal peptidase I [Defluviitaleaceae bacterium]
MNEAVNKKIIKELFEWLRDIIIAALVTLFIINFLFQNTQVIGDSMEPSLEDGHSVIINKFIYRFKAPQRGDIIAFKSPVNPSEHHIKRIIGIPGDTVEIKEGKVYLNGILLKEDYILEPMDAKMAGDMEYPLMIGPDSYFVMGDNRNISYDSRYKEIGLIDESSISGKALIRIWPLNKIGRVK